MKDTGTSFKRDFNGLKIGFAVTGSFCTISDAIPQLEEMVNQGADVYPIMSEMTHSTDTRFGKAADLVWQMESATGRKVICTISGAEPIGPGNMLDALVIAPCTGNTLSKMAGGINDSAVTMAAKAHLRNLKPLVIGISTNDGLGANAKNIGLLQNTKNIFFVPYRQDDAIGKCNSLISDMTLIMPTLIEALANRQIQPMFATIND